MSDSSLVTYLQNVVNAGLTPGTNKYEIAQDYIAAYENDLATYLDTRSNIASLSYGIFSNAASGANPTDTQVQAPSILANSTSLTAIDKLGFDLETLNITTISEFEALFAYTGNSAALATTSQTLAGAINETYALVGTLTGLNQTVINQILDQEEDDAALQTAVDTVVATVGDSSTGLVQKVNSLNITLLSTITYTQGNITALSNSLTTAYTTADAVVTTAYTAADAVVTSAFQAADTALHTAITAETTAAIAEASISGGGVDAYTKTQSNANYTSLTANYTAADAAVTTAFHTADTALSSTLTTAFTAADAAVTTAYTAADAAVTTAFHTADTALSSTLTTAFTAADAAVTTAFTAADAAVTTAYTAADAAVTTAYTAADAVVTAAFQAADTAQYTNITNAYTAADAVVTTAFTAADAAQYTNITTTYQAADTALNSRVTTLESAVTELQSESVDTYTKTESDAKYETQTDFAAKVGSGAILQYGSGSFYGCVANTSAWPITYPSTQLIAHGSNVHETMMQAYLNCSQWALHGIDNAGSSYATLTGLSGDCEPFDTSVAFVTCFAALDVAPA